MLLIPIESEGHKRDALIVVLGPDNLERMRTGDPVRLETKHLPSLGKNLVSPILFVCYEEPSPEFNRVVQEGDLDALLAYLQRGWKFRPELGDNDDVPRKIFEGN